MKSVIISVVLLAAFTGIFAQNSKLDEIFSKFQGKDGITTVTINSDLIKIASQMQDSSLDALKNITQVRIISLERAQAQDIVNFENMIKEVPLKDFKELMVVKAENDNVRMLAREDQGRWSDFLLIVSGGKDHALINIQGSLSPKDLQELSKSMKIHGMDSLKSLK